MWVYDVDYASGTWPRLRDADNLLNRNRRASRHYTSQASP